VKFLKDEIKERKIWDDGIFPIYKMEERIQPSLEKNPKCLA
jgi:hypothetical protein